ncbi:MAG TPA: hypothetical protein P5340_13010, partial [Defluviicoccus sp.]|nr:hypothetical protein [Defluviicoccus sp.]
MAVIGFVPSFGAPDPCGEGRTLRLPLEHSNLLSGEQPRSQHAGSGPVPVRIVPSGPTPEGNTSPRRIENAARRP